MEFVQKMTPWDYMPPEQHFPNPRSLKDAIFTYQASRLQEWEKADPRFLPKPGTFEAILSEKTGKFRLWPAALDYIFLFRGQQEFHYPCIPTLFRGERSADELFIERLKLVEFELMIEEFPTVKFFRSHNYDIDVLGLAQHYLIDTEILDLTSSLDVALFFAMCDFDGHNYHPKQEEKEYIAYIYAYPFMQEINISDGLSLCNRLTPIGLQPFKRPGEQCGYALKMKKGESLRTTLYSFSFTKEDSETVFNWFKERNPLFFEDDFSRRVDELRASHTFSVAALRIAAKRFSGECYGKQKNAAFCQARLNDMGYHFKDSRMPWWPTDSELVALRRDFNETGRKSILEKIVTRHSYSEVTGKLPYCTESTFASMLYLKMMAGGCPALPGYDAEFEVSYVDNEKMSCMSYHYGRPQTEPNKETGKIDRWDHLDWSKYPHLKIDKTTGKVILPE